MNIPAGDTSEPNLTVTENSGSFDSLALATAHTASFTADGVERQSGGVDASAAQPVDAQSATSSNKGCSGGAAGLPGGFPGDPDGAVHTFPYDSASGRMTALVDPRSNATTVAYDFAGRVDSVSRPDATTEQFTPRQVQSQRNSP